MEDIAPALLEQLQGAFLENLENDKTATKLQAEIQAGTATYAKAGDYAEQVGTALADAFSACLSSDVLPDGKLYWNIADRVVRPLLEQDYELVSDTAAQVQTALNEAAGIGIKAQTAALDTDKVDGLLNKISAADHYDDVAWALGEPVKTFSRSVVDDTVKANVEFQGESGLSPKIIRKASSGACQWCLDVAGTYTYPNVPKDVYRRHRNCSCSVEYDPGSGKRQNVWTKKWTSAKEADKIEARMQLERTATQKAEIQKLLKLPSSKQISIPAKRVDTSSLGIDLEHITEAGHTATKESAIAWIKEAKFSVDVWNGQYTRFIAQDGATYVNNAGNYIRTAYSRAEFTPNLIEALEVLDDGGN